MKSYHSPDGGSGFSLKHSTFAFRPQEETRGNVDLLRVAPLRDECPSELSQRKSRGQGHPGTCGLLSSTRALG